MKLKLFLCFFCIHSFFFSQKKSSSDKEESMRSALWLPIADFKNSPVKMDSIGFGDLPKEIEYRGLIVEAVKWNDSLGTHFLLLTQTGPFSFKDSSGDVNERAEVYAYLFSKKRSEKNFTRTWKLNDYVICFGVDMYAGFYARSLTITDLDKDGVPEITFIYKTSCRGGITPSTQKLFMYENQDKYAMRGETLIDGGDPKINNSNNFTADAKLRGKPEFFEYAMKRWAKIGPDDYKQFR